MQQHGSKYFSHIPPSHLTLRMGSKRQNSIFSEHGHVAYQIKEYQESNMVANILPADTPPSPPWGWGQ